MTSSDTPELVLDARAVVGEGPCWDARRQLLYWVDILSHELHIYDPATSTDRAINVGQYVGAVVTRAGGGVMLALHHGFGAFDPDSGQLEIIHDPEAHLPGSRFNDGKCDPAGRFWAGTLPLDNSPEIASLYCLDTDLTVRTMLTGVSNSNGLAWTQDNATMYYIDTPTHQVAAFDYDRTSGEISNRRVAFEVPSESGWPDGMCIDAEGMLWIGVWGGGEVSRWDPTSGSRVGGVRVPATQVTSCAFGGADLDELYITTARMDLDEAALAEQPFAGGLFRARPGVKGLPTFEFAG